ncbi:TorD/DmsD family molecular chaperone [Salisediminibacterium halotolerans]|uniref:Chaperone TorD involved in molybdoenzyme TorA maturation n=1 Tax=Salisediminibacterium halotolerans TaxID=517425 RepID=A0A1H9WU39_9BACI|nr:molecular chaperone TorD family protein [Salisediminibacterium haloalkalitolerans]SES37460.1 chaperone TorD involved in molybdoenzyme TorA maturation [Salisediminibacterium haloalkalitolerans]
MTAKEAYISMLTLFAELYKYPDKDTLKQIASGAADKELRETAAYLALPPEAYDRRLQALHTENNPITTQYMKAFSGIVKPFYPPVESLYKPWSTDPNAPDGKGRRRGHYMGDSALHLKHLLGSHGFAIPREYENMPDHLAIELELYAYLVDQDSAGAKLFHRDHFDWLEEFCANLQELGEIPFYIETTRMLLHLLAKDPQCYCDGKE